jgi:hypothetical protein
MSTHSTATSPKDQRQADRNGRRSDAERFKSLGDLPLQLAIEQVRILKESAAFRTHKNRRFLSLPPKIKSISKRNRHKSVKEEAEPQGRLEHKSLAGSAFVRLFSFKSSSVGSGGQRSA